MSRNYKFHNKEGLYFVSFAIIYWIDVSKQAIESNPQESRKEWLLWIFPRAGKKNITTSKYQF